MQCHPELSFQLIRKMPKAHLKSTATEEDPHGSINPAEAKAHVDSLDKVMTMIGEQVKKQDTADLWTKP